MPAWIKSLHRIENALLVLLLTTMIVLASTQIVLRNLFDAGLLWVDPLLRVLVLWLALLGAMIAARENKHIRIDLLSRYFKQNTHHLIDSLTGQVSAWTCFVIAWFGLQWIHLDYTDGLRSFAGIPAWLLEVIVPLSFGVIGLRYLVFSLAGARAYWLDRPVQGGRSR